MRLVRLYGRPECHLCDEAREELRRLLAQGAEFELEEVDIEADPVLHAVYLERIPVLEVDGAVISELVPDGDAIRAALHTVPR